MGKCERMAEDAQEDQIVESLKEDKRFLQWYKLFIHCFGRLI